MRLGLGNRLACDLDTHWLSRADLLEVGHSEGNVVQLFSLSCQADAVVRAGDSQNALKAWHKGETVSLNPISASIKQLA